MNRKSFLKQVSALGLFLGVSPAMLAESSSNETNQLISSQAVKSKGNMIGFKLSPIQKVRVAIIGLGNRGTTLLEMFNWLVENQHAEIVALADLHAEKVDKAETALAKFQQTPIKKYSGSEDAWQKAITENSVDLVIIATPWKQHAPMTIFAMENGANVGCEVPLAPTLKECWEIIQTAERTQKHAMLLENCCFNEEELWVLNMVNEGVFGDLTHAECAYIHDLRKHLIDDKYYDQQWRLKEHQTRNGNLYTTHGLGPVCHYMKIGRGDYFDYLTSMSSLEQNLSGTAKRMAKDIGEIKCGDMNTTLIRTMKGRTIMVQNDVKTGRPYDRINLLSGTKATHRGYPSKLYIDDAELKWWGHEWLSDEKYKEYREKYNHPLWKKMEEQISRNSMGHGGMDFVMIFRLVRCLNIGIPLDIDVYESALWSAVSPLSELSVAKNSQPIKVPDFYNGAWKNDRSVESLREVL